MVKATPRPLYARERPGTLCIGGGVGPRAGLDGCGKSRPPTGTRSPNRPARSESLYRQNYRGSQELRNFPKTPKTELHYSQSRISTEHHKKTCERGNEDTVTRVHQFDTAYSEGASRQPPQTHNVVFLLLQTGHEEKALPTGDLPATDPC